MNLKLLLAALIAVLWPVSIWAGAGGNANITPPGVTREFRGVWVATVNNIDWPSKPGLPTAVQKSELINILDTASRLKLNAIVLQVRPAGDVFYPSPREPWSPFITGFMGRPPEPYYDPLGFAIDEAHRRGLELHAWINPFRASHPSFKSPIATNHVSRSHPEWVKQYGSLQWLDPGEPAARDYAFEAVMEIVTRYDVDGVQFDDYYYPYAEKDGHSKVMDFPDEPSWKRFGVESHLSRADWRRANINGFIERVYRSIKAAKPWVKFGVSPFGIWQPGDPPQIKGKNSYEEVYADSRKWLQNGWVDYFAPQLYWRTSDKGQSFPVLLKWWEEQNILHRNLWPGLAASNVGTKWKPAEIIDQIRRTRQQEGASGDILYDIKPLLENRAGLAAAVRTEVYIEPALIPAFPWLEPHPLPVAKPFLALDHQTHVTWEPPGGNPFLWVLQNRVAGHWHTQILPGHLKSCGLPAAPDAVALTAIDRFGVMGPTQVVKAGARNF